MPDFAEHFDVTIYQIGHILGGKTASTKDQREGHGHHNLEHGLHIMMARQTASQTIIRTAEGVAENARERVKAGLI